MENTGTEIRVMLPKDYEDAMALWTEADGVGTGPDDDRDFIERYLRRNPATSFVAVEGGRLIGAIMAGHDGYRGFIHHTAVAPAYRGRGVGAALVRSALKALEAEGIRKAVLVALKTNTSGNAFWERQGFAVRSDLCYRDLRFAGPRP